MYNPKVSIITPSFNQGRFIEETILSVLSQDYPNIEYIIIDGASTDNTLEIFKKYYKKIIWKSEPDNGQTQAINKGFKMATGEILAWQNSDDTYLPKTISIIVDFFLNNPNVGMVYGYFNYIDENGDLLFTKKIIDFSYRQFTCGRFHPVQATVFFRRSVLEEVGYLDEDFHYSMDTEFYCRIGKKFIIALIPEVLGTFRIYPQSKTGQKASKRRWRKEELRIRKIYAPGIINKFLIVYYLLRAKIAYYLKYRNKLNNHLEQ
ncbi:MAG: glycosyltransferase family 2 protein [Candidatus Omnitrophica bacterium]|nr:glycosyltransferase family 2 protein [Candidatus Omnitrophota bacterium]